MATKDQVIDEWLRQGYGEHDARILQSGVGISRAEITDYVQSVRLGVYNAGPVATPLTIATTVDTADVAVEVAADDTDGTVASWVIVTVPESGEGTVDIGGSALEDDAAVTSGQAASLVYNAPSSAGTYTFTYAAVDNDGKQGEPATVTVTVAES